MDKSVSKELNHAPEQSTRIFIGRQKQVKIHNVWHPNSDYQACQEA